MGLAYGVAITFDSLAMILAPLLAGVLYSRNPDWVYLTTLLLVILVILVTMSLFPRPPQPGREGIKE